MSDFIEFRLEVVQDHGVCQAFEHEAKLPKWIDTHGQRRFQCVGDRENIKDDEHNAEEHSEKHHRKPGRNTHNLSDSELIFGLDGVEEENCRYNPPRITTRSAKSARDNNVVTYRQNASQGRVLRKTSLMLWKYVKLA